MRNRRFSLFLFHLLTSRSRDIRSRLTTGGALLLGGVVASAVFTVDITRTQAYQIFALLSALLVVSILFSVRFRDRFSLVRPLPRHATLGQPLEYSVTLINDSGRVQDNLSLRETLPESYPTPEEFLNTTEPGAKKRNWFDRHVAYHRYLWLTNRKQGFAGKSVPIPRMPVNGTCRVALSLTPTRRGRIELEGITLMRPDPLGLILAHQYHALPVSLLVLPKRYALPAGFQLPGTRQHQAGGVQSASSVGDSEEFVALREYREGDSLRRIYWPGLARHNKLLVREYQNEFFTRYGLILDTFVTPEQDLAAFEEAVSLAASFAVMVESGDALLDLLFVGDQAYHFTAGRSLAHLEQIMEILACVDINTRHPFEQLTQLVLSQPVMLSSCVVILLTWDAERSALVRRLDGMGLPLVVLVIGDSGGGTPLPAWTHPASRLWFVPVGQAEGILARLEL